MIADKRMLLRVLMLLALAMGTGNVSALADTPPQKVVYHISEAASDRQRTALRNVRNHLDQLGDDAVEIAVVLQGDGVTLLLLPEAEFRLPQGLSANASDQVQVSVENLRVRGVNFEVCSSSLQRRGISGLQQLYGVDAADLVPSGLAELVRLQDAGYTYIKP